MFSCVMTILCRKRGCVGGSLWTCPKRQGPTSSFAPRPLSKPYNTPLAAARIRTVHGTTVILNWQFVAFSAR